MEAVGGRPPGFGIPLPMRGRIDAKALHEARRLAGVTLPALTVVTTSTVLPAVVFNCGKDRQSTDLVAVLVGHIDHVSVISCATSQRPGALPLLGRTRPYPRHH